MLYSSTSKNRNNIKINIKAIILVILMLCVLVPKAHSTVIRDTEIEEVLLQIIHPMAKNANINPKQIQIRVVNNSHYNAFVTADNIIYLHSGLILSATNMLEIAGVIAHEIGHIAAGHIPRRSEVLNDATRIGVLGTALAIALTASGNADAATGVLAGSLDQSQRLYFAHSRQDESAADKWAVRLMQNQNLSLIPLTNAMRRLANESALPATRQSEYYRTHPGARERSIVFQDHVNNDEHEASADLQWMQENFIRIKTKLNAWTLPPKTTLANHSSNIPEDIYQRAIALFRINNLAAAEEEMLTLLEKRPNDPYYEEFLGDILLTQGRPDAAAKYYKKSLSHLSADANKGQIYVSLGRALLMIDDQNSFNEAVTYLELARLAESDWAFAIRQLGIAYGKTGRLTEADITLAEEALLRKQAELARTLAQRAINRKGASAVHKRIANDILRQSNQ